jgi:hypothetical protein
MKEIKNVFIILDEKCEGKRQLDRHRCRYKCDIERYLKDIGCEDVDWV